MSNEVILAEGVRKAVQGESAGQEASLAQSEIIRKNISAITEVRRQEDGKRTLSTRISDLITDFSGSMAFVWLHAVWFGIWVLLNVGLLHIPRISEFDPFPFGLLTMVVSLEAIFLSTFVLISQNRMASQSERRAELDLHINLLAEQKATKALEILDQLTSQLNQLKRFDLPRDPEVEALKVSPEPQEVLQVLQETVKEEAKAATDEVGRVAAEAATKAVREELENTGEMVREEVGRVEEKVEAVASDVRQIKERK
ncbi:MAG: DUF1003 domain-containing protein [Pyrinomonadaceae bacterium]